MPTANMDYAPRKKNPGMFISPLSEESDGSDVLASPTTTVASSPAESAEGDKKGQFFQSFKDRARRSFSVESLPAAFAPRSHTPRNPSVGSLNNQVHGRTQGRRLSKRNSSVFEMLSRRSSGVSDTQIPEHQVSNASNVSRAPTHLSSSSTSSTQIDWTTQTLIYGYPLESDSQLLRKQIPYLAITADYVLKLKSELDVYALFPQNLPPGQHPNSLLHGSIRPEPLLVIPIRNIVSVFDSESTKPSFGLEIWWTEDKALDFKHHVLWFTLPRGREEMLQHVVERVHADNKEAFDYLRFSPKVGETIRRLFAAEEPSYQHQELQIFPVVPRGATVKDILSRAGEKSKNLDGRAFYLAVGANQCCYVEISKTPTKNGELAEKHCFYGLVTLEVLRGHWTPHEERFIMAFRQPFKQATTLELSSRHYRNIIRVFHKADRFLKPAWPQMLQNDIFKIYGLKEPHYVIDREDYGGLNRTLNAYIAAYRCKPVEWEINWRTQFAPEFRLLPLKDGIRYTNLQLLAVMRALRYNDYFESLSFRDVDLAVMWRVYDRYSNPATIACINRSCVHIGREFAEYLEDQSILYNEMHALAFCSEKIRQIDFTNSFREFHVIKASERATGSPVTVEFLAPILRLLEQRATKCNRLLLAGNALSTHDIASLIYNAKNGLFEALDLSRCSLCDVNLRELIQYLSCNPETLQKLDISGNRGRIPARIIPDLIHLFTNLRELNVAGCLIGTVPEPLIPCEDLAHMSRLRELDISQYKVNDATISALEEYLQHRSTQLAGGVVKLNRTMRQLTLNHCGVTGTQAGQLFQAIGENNGMSISLNGNPLEEGIEDLARAIQMQKGPEELHMDMIEFRDESKFRRLLRALAVARYLTVLSLVGTTPIPSIGSALHSDTVGTIEIFFLRNQSIRYLDFSGYCGKLDEGQMGKGFGTALKGLSSNQTMTHLRLRNQNLSHNDIGTLGQALRKNGTLQMLDCQDNGLNMSTLQFLISAIKESRSLTEFVLEPEEKARIWQRIRSSLKGPMPNGGGSTRGYDPHGHEGLLYQQFEAMLADLERHLEANRQRGGSSHPAAAGEEEVGDDVFTPRPHDPHGKAVSRGWHPPHPHERSESSDSTSYFGGSDLIDGLVNPEATPRANRRMATVKSSAIALDTAVAAPYYVRPEEGMESPTEGLMASSPVEMGSPLTPEEEEEAEGFGLYQKFQDMQLAAEWDPEGSSTSTGPQVGH